MKKIEKNERKLENIRKTNFKEKGITLVALVITIIILLILAGVTLSTALSENGLFQRAKISAEKYQESEKQEQKSLGEVEGEIDELTKPKKTTMDVEDIGKRVNYEVDLDGDPKTYDWKLFYQGTEEDGLANGRIYIIAADYVPLSNSLLTTATDENNANMTLSSNSIYQKFCKDWTGKTPSALQSMTDRNLFMTSMYNLDTKSTISAKCVSTLLNTKNWSGFASGKYGEKAIGGPTLEMWLAAWNKLMPKDGSANEDGYVRITPSAENTESGYKVSSKSMKNKDWLFVDGTQTEAGWRKNLITSKEKYHVFFPFTTSAITSNGVYGQCAGYWLSSPSGNDFNGGDIMCIDANCSVEYDSSSYEYSNGFRPIVLLRTGIHINWNEEEQVYEIGI